MTKAFRASMLSLLIASLVIVAACGGNNSQSESSSSPSGSSSPSSSSPSKEGSKPAEMVTITHVVTGDSASRDKWLNETAEAVGVKLDIQVLPLDQFEQIYKVKAGTNDLPDMINYHPGARTRDDLKASEKLVDLSDLALVQNIHADILPYYQEKDGKVYGIPGQAVKFGGILYNKKVFADAGVAVPQSLEELLAASEKLKAAGVTPFYLSAKDSWTLQIPGLAAFSYDQLHSPGILDKINANEASFTDAKNFIEAYETLLTMLDKGYINSDYLSATYANAQQAIVDGQVAMYPVLSSVIGALADNYPDKVNDMGFFPWPVAGEKAVTAWPPMILGIPKSSKNIDEVKKLIEFYATNEGQALYFENQPSAGVPAFKGVTLDESKLLEPVKEMIQLSNTAKQFATMDFSVVANMGAFGEQVQEILLKVKTPTNLAEYLMDTLRNNAKSAGIAGF